jgi:hypothetical protein
MCIQKHIQDTKHAHMNQEFEHNELQNCKINHWKWFVVLNHFIFALTCCFLITHVICASICLFLIHIDSLWSPQDPSRTLPTIFHDSTTSSLTKPSRPMQPLKIHHTQSKVQTLYVQNPHNINPKPWWPKSKQNTDSQFSILQTRNWSSKHDNATRDMQVLCLGSSLYVHCLCYVSQFLSADLRGERWGIRSF